jgi:2-polyprenyl-6-hydroxyphenyl methylase/3-demethylubiquinone-9 3-methyltransferase
VSRTANDLSLYDRHADRWWNPRSLAFRSLHVVSEFHWNLLREWLGARLEHGVVVDLGCGGGLLSAPPARSGARVLGVDRSRRSLAAAAGRIGRRFVCGDALRAPLSDGGADVVVLADVVEHLPYAGVIGEAARILRPGGLCFVSTLNRTARARWLAVHLAEGLRLVPPGTHDPELFVRPEELRREGERRGLAQVRIQGQSVDLLRTLRRWAVHLQRSEDLSLGYCALFRKGARA